MIIFVFAPQLKERKRRAAADRLKSPDLQLIEILYTVSAEGDVKHSNEEKGEAGVNHWLFVISQAVVKYIYSSAVLQYRFEDLKPFHAFTQSFKF